VVLFVLEGIFIDYVAVVRLLISCIVLINNMAKKYTVAFNIWLNRRWRYGVWQQR